MRALVLASVLLLACCAEAPARERVVTTPLDEGRREHTEREAPDGTWVATGPVRIYGPDGALVEEGAWTDGERSGRWREYHPDGTIAAEGGYLFGRREGVWVHRDTDGAIDMGATGVFEDGARVGDWYEEGLRVGRLKSGLLQRATYAHGLRNGRAEGLYPEGTQESLGDYVDGLMSGPWTFWAEDGALDPEQSGVYALHVKVADLPEDGR